MFSRTILLALSTVMVSGCAFTMHDVNVGYRYDKPVKADLRSAPKGGIKVSEIADTRGTANPRLIMNMKNMNGDTTSGGWQAEKPLAEIVRDGLSQGLSKAKASLVESGEEVSLEGQLLDFNTQTVMGVWEGTINSKITVKLKLKRAGKTVWGDTFVGNASTKGGEGAEGALRDAIDNLVTRVLEDDLFLQQLKPAPEISS